MSFNIKVANLENKYTWEKQLTSSEFEKVKDFKSKNTVSFIPAAFKPVRTNNLKNFSRDFFLPTIFNHAIKVQNTVSKIFAILASLVLDLLTFPIRLFTAIPRVISNAKQEENPLRNYLIAEGVDQKLLESDYVRVKLEWVTKSQVATSIRRTKEGTIERRYDQKRHSSVENVNFIELPTYEGSDFYVEGSDSYFGV